jgi:hypothetical protein
MFLCRGGLAGGERGGDFRTFMLLSHSNPMEGILASRQTVLSVLKTVRLLISESDEPAAPKASVYRLLAKRGLHSREAFAAFNWVTALRQYENPFARRCRIR